jgi:hypothetical protein
MDPKQWGKEESDPKDQVLDIWGDEPLKLSKKERKFK